MVQLNKRLWLSDTDNATTEKRSDNTKKRKASLKGFNARVKETENNGFKSHKISNLDNGKVERRK